jgi:hypothetical protein
MNIPASAIAPFGYTGIPVLMTPTLPDITDIFGYEFLKYVKQEIVNSLTMTDNKGWLHIRMLVQSLNRRRTNTINVSNVCISRTHDDKFYIEYDVDGHHQHQLMLTLS